MESNDAPLKSTPLAEEHLKLGAKMVPFAGWNMPVQYSEGILAEHKHTREEASLFDICHMGEFVVKGLGAELALDSILARPVADQPVGVCRYNFLLAEDGGVIDDLIVYRTGVDEFFIVVNAGTREGDAAEFKRLLPGSLKFEDQSDSIAKLDLQGPKSAEVLEKLGLKAESLPEYYRWGRATLDGVACLISRTGYTGELGFELYFKASKAAKIWSLLLSVPPVKPAGLGARDTLRLEMGYPLYGHELNRQSTPVEAGFGQMLKLAEKPRSFQGSAALRSARQTAKRLVGIELEGRRAAREGSSILIGSATAGKVSSGAFGPSIGKAIAMGYVDSAFEERSFPGATVEVDTGRGLIKGFVSTLPFYKSGTARKKLGKI